MMILKALATFALSLGMGMIGFFLGGIIYMGISEYLLEMSNEQVARAIAIALVFGSAVVGGIFGLQKGARWTKLMESLNGD
tara:strand:+ start:228 stop:470 length:243 start_codon:yes stop_codon:yes gene_type:complete